MGVVGAANKYLSDMEPWKLQTTDPERMASVLHVALQVVDDVKTLLTPFLPSSSAKVHAALGGTGDWARDARAGRGRRADRGRARRPTRVLTGDYETGATLGVDADRGRPADGRRRRRSSPSSTRPSSTRNWPGWKRLIEHAMSASRR